MSDRPPPTPEEFEATFRDDIRVGFNWERFLAERWPIERVTLTDRAALDRCSAPWYVVRAGESVPYDDVHAFPMSLRDVPKAFEILSDERKADIRGKIEKFRDREGVVRLTVPTYGLPDGSYFVLDRNHRLAALVVTNFPFDVELWNVLGPPDKDALLDLHHWLKDEGSNQ